MYFVKIIGKLFLKAITFITLVTLTLVNSILKVAFFLIGMLSVPVATVVALVACVMMFIDGFNMSIAALFGTALVLISLKYLLPLIPRGLDSVKFMLNDYLQEPVIIRSPVKYTL